MSIPLPKLLSSWPYAFPLVESSTRKGVQQLSENSVWAPVVGYTQLAVVLSPVPACIFDLKEVRTEASDSVMLASSADGFLNPFALH